MRRLETVIIVAVLAITVAFIAVGEANGGALSNPGGAMQAAFNHYAASKKWATRMTAISCTKTGKLAPWGTFPVWKCVESWNKPAKIVCPVFRAARQHPALNKWAWLSVKCSS